MRRALSEAEAFVSRASRAPTKRGDRMWRRLLFPDLRVDQVLRPFAQQRTAQVIHREIGHGFTGFVGVLADVRQGDGILQLEQR
jgi:hypothetical protein